MTNSVIEITEGTIGSGPAGTWFRYSVRSDMLQLRLTGERFTETVAERTSDDLLLLRRMVDDVPVGLIVVGWWKRFGGGIRPDSMQELGAAIELSSRRMLDRLALPTNSDVVSTDLAAKFANPDLNMPSVSAVVQASGNVNETTISSSLRELLAGDHRLLEAFVRWATEQKWKLGSSLKLHSILNEQVVRDTLGVPRRIDLQVRYWDGEGRLRTIRCEHKWLAMTDPNQLSCYRDLSDLPAEDVCLCFLTPHEEEARVAGFHCDRAGTWVELAQRLAAANPADSLLAAWTQAISTFSRSHRNARRGLDSQTLQLASTAVNHMFVDSRLRGKSLDDPDVPRQVLPPHWDRCAVYFGLNTLPALSVHNCRCVYFGFRYHRSDLSIPIAGNRALDLVFAAHGHKDSEPFAADIIQRAATTLADLPPEYRPSVICPPGKVKGRWHKLVAIREISIQPQAMGDARAIADYALEVWPHWWSAVAELGAVLKQP